MKRIIGILLCFYLLLSAPMTVNAKSLQETIKYIQKAEKMTKSAYTQKKIKCKALPLNKAKTVGKIKINTEIKYRNYNKKWAITVYKGHLVFVARKYLKAADYTPSYFRKMGIVGYNGWRWTWYSQRVLPGGGLRIPGRHIDELNMVCDRDNYICLASSDLAKGSVVDTPFGKKGKVYDDGCSSGTLDVYCNF